jgi:hypothetical protein
MITNLNLTAALPCLSSITSHTKPLKVFILDGQSNIEGPASINTFDYIGDDPATAPMQKKMRGADGKPTVCDGVSPAELANWKRGASNFGFHYYSCDKSFAETMRKLISSPKLHSQFTEPRPLHHHENQPHPFTPSLHRSSHSPFGLIDGPSPL